MHYVLCRILVLVLFSSQLDYEAPTEVHSHFPREQPSHNMSPGICEATEALQQSLSGKSTAFSNNSPLESLGIYFLFYCLGGISHHVTQFCSPPSPPLISFPHPCSNPQENQNKTKHSKQTNETFLDSPCFPPLQRWQHWVWCVT